MAPVVGGDKRQARAERHADEPAQRGREGGNGSFDAGEVEAVGVKGETAKLGVETLVLRDGPRKIGGCGRLERFRSRLLLVDRQVRERDELAADQAILEGAWPRTPRARALRMAA